MDAIVGVWLTSVIGAGAFAAAGYVAGQRGVILPFLQLPAPPPPPPPVERTPEPPAAQSDALKTPSVPFVAFGAEAPTSPGGERPTLVPKEEAAPSVPTIPPARVPSVASEADAALAARAAIALAEVDELKSELRDARKQAQAATERARAAEVVRAELEKQVESLRADLRDEVAARATAVSQAEQLGDRLAGASGEAASLRHKVATLDKQLRQLKDELSGKGRAATTSDWARRQLEETEEMRNKLRDVYDKIERTSLPPTGIAPTGSLPPGNPRTISTIPRDSARARKITATETLPDVDLDAYRSIIERARSIAGLRGIVIADEVGSVLVGSGELSDSLAAFGAYIRDASTRTDRLLPLEGIEQIDIRDRTGMILCTRVVTHEPSAVSLVVLGVADSTIAAARKITEEALRMR